MVTRRIRRFGLWIGVMVVLGGLMAAGYTPGQCVPVDPQEPVCVAPGDCDGLAHPDCAGGWTCEDGACAWECGPVCHDDGDCGPGARCELTITDQCCAPGAICLAIYPPCSGVCVPRTATEVELTPFCSHVPYFLGAGGTIPVAVFGETTGWERAHWFALPGEAGEYRYSWGRPDWFDAAGREHRAARQAVALFDLSSIGKFLIEGPNALQTVQHVFSADLDRPPGTITYTCLLNQRGGVEADLTVTRLAEQSFLAVVPTTTQNRTCHWLRRHAAEQTVIRDVTNGLGTLGVMGPGAAGLLSALTGASLDDAAFPYGTARWIEIGWVNILALRVSFVGELGWELYAPVEQCVTLFDQLIAAGAEHDLRLAGYHALDSLRAEKGFLHWGADVGPADTPFEAGIGFTVALDKQGGFVGREALAPRFHGPRAEAAQPVSSGGRPGDRPPSAGRRDTARMLVKLRLDHPEQLLYHGESLLLDDRVIGRVTSGAYGFTLGCAVGLAFLEAPPEEIEATLTARAVEVDCAGVRVPATIGRQPFYDPEGLRMRASAGIA